MNPEQENFEQLRRLLALKRHETPPIGYFNDFSRQVVAKIQVQEQKDQHFGSGRLNREAPWIVRIWQLLEAKPLLAGGFGMLAISAIGRERVERDEHSVGGHFEDRARSFRAAI